MPSIEKQIREQAYFIWLQEGCPEGRDHLHWQIASEQVQPNVIREKSAKATRSGRKAGAVSATRVRIPRELKRAGATGALMPSPLRASGALG